MKPIVALFALLAVFAGVDAQLPGYGPQPYGMMNMGYPPAGYPAYPGLPPQAAYNPGYNDLGLGTSDNANANSNTNVNSNAGAGLGRWY